MGSEVEGAGLAGRRRLAVAGEMWTWLVVPFALGVVAAAEMGASRTCEPIKIPMCQNLGYNLTGMPNLAGHELQRDAMLQVQTYAPLVQYGCSTRLRFFLCSVYVPMCTEKVPEPIGPCRPLCEAVRERCAPVLSEFGFSWPPGLNCSQFPPENNDRHMCMEGPEPGTDVSPIPRPTSRVPGVIKPAKHVPLPVCPSPRQIFLNSTGRCVQECHADVLFSSEDKKFASRWILGWASLSLVSSLFTLAMFVCRTSHFRYAERVVVYVAGSLLMFSAGYVTLAAAGREAAACGPAPHDPSRLLLLREGLDRVPCTALFVLLYFFGSSAAAWWTALCVVWLASVLRKNAAPPNRHRDLSACLHLAAWGLPAAGTVAALVTRAIEADELTGACGVSPRARLSLVIAPLAICCTVGGVCLAYAFRLLALRRRAMGNADDLTPRVGIFALLYFIPAVFVLSAQVYEHVMRDSWLDGSSVPNVEVFTLKLFMSLVTGITSGLWMWSTEARPRANLACKKGPGGPYAHRHQFHPLLLDKVSRNKNITMV